MFNFDSRDIEDLSIFTRKRPEWIEAQLNELSVTENYNIQKKLFMEFIKALKKKEKEKDLITFTADQLAEWFRKSAMLTLKKEEDKGKKEILDTLFLNIDLFGR